MFEGIIMKKKDCVKQLVFGVSFNHMFKLLDYWGEIADDILYKNKYFSSEVFTNISTQYTTERSLSNPQKQHSLVITSNNLVFTQTIEEDYDKEYELFKTRITEYIIPKILCKYILVVRRLGIVYISEFNEHQLLSFSSKYFKPTVQNIMDFRFSKKEPTSQGKLISDNTDFINKIFTVGNLKNEFQGISYDYQMHFNPLREDVRDVIASFINKADNDFTIDILNNIEG